MGTLGVDEKLEKEDFSSWHEFSVLGSQFSVFTAKDCANTVLSTDKQAEGATKTRETPVHRRKVEN
jgi:hypothetical protein